jgi:hypothetical protein
MVCPVQLPLLVLCNAWYHVGDAQIVHHTFLVHLVWILCPAKSQRWQAINTPSNMPMGKWHAIKTLSLATKPFTVRSTSSWTTCTAAVIFEAWRTCKKQHQLTELHSLWLAGRVEAFGCVGSTTKMSWLTLSCSIEVVVRTGAEASCMSRYWMSSWMSMVFTPLEEPWLAPVIGHLGSHGRINERNLPCIPPWKLPSYWCSGCPKWQYLAARLSGR